MRLPVEFGLLRDPDYRRFFVSTAASQLGFYVTLLALPLVAVLALDAGELEVGLLTALTTVAFVVIGLPAGAWVDRMARRNILILGDLCRALALASIPVAWWAGVLSIWQLYGVALLLSVCTVFFDLAYQSYLPFLVGRANLLEGNAKLESVRAASQVGGPGIAGQLVQLLGAPIAVLANAVTLGLSVLLITRISRREPRPEPKPGAHLRREIGEGLRFVLGNPSLRAIAIGAGWFNFCYGGGFTALLLVFLVRDLRLPEGTIGLILAASAVGGILGGAIARGLAARFGQGPVMWVSAAVMAPFALLVPLAQPGGSVWLAGGGLFAIGVGVVVFNVTQLSIRQSITPDAMLGRMNATVRWVAWGLIPLGALTGGIVGQWLGARTTLFVAALSCCLTFVPLVLSPARNVHDLSTARQP
jgi:MFS family permease